MRKYLAPVVASAALCCGCSTAPVAGFLDAVAPSRVEPQRPSGDLVLPPLAEPFPPPAQPGRADELVLPPPRLS